MRKLEMGDTIGIFSPSSPITYTVPERFHRAKAYLEAKGFNIIEGALTGKQDYYRSGTIKERADELNQLIRNPEVKCIMSTIGGMNSNSILPYIDYEAFRKNPKIIIGYSDVTAILLAIYAKTGISTFYGPALVASFGEFPSFVDNTYEYFRNMLIEDVTLPYEFPMPEYWTDEYIDWSQQDREKEKRKNQWITVYEGIARGRLIGGNLNTMTGIWGSQYMPEIKEGDILFIEDSLEDAATVERSFSLLKLNGVFDKVSGIILGKHELFDDMRTGRKPYEILLEVLGERQLPFMADFDCCHTHPMLTLPIGVEVELDATNKKVKMLSSVFDGSTI
ncbi:MAG: S66 family peptidase [Lutispora sp.]|jgi:muramoyltetrapeptide carboxypeptidase